MRNTNRIRGYARRANWHKTTKPDAIKGWWSKCGNGAGKVNVLTWGDLLSGHDGSGNSGQETRLRRQESAEAIVPSPSRWEGPNDKPGTDFETFEG